MRCPHRPPCGSPMPLSLLLSRESGVWKPRAESQALFCLLLGHIPSLDTSSFLLFVVSLSLFLWMPLHLSPSLACPPSLCLFLSLSLWGWWFMLSGHCCTKQWAAFCCFLNNLFFANTSSNAIRQRQHFFIFFFSLFWISFVFIILFVYFLFLHFIVRELQKK